MSTFSGVELSKRALAAQSASLNTVGHNISNLNTEGFSRQRVDLKTMVPLYIPGTRPEVPGQIGQGVEQSQIIRYRDLQVDMQIFMQGHKEGYWNTRNEYISRMESMYAEVGDASLRNLLDRYWESWQEVSINPESGAARVQLLERADTLTNAIQDRYSRLVEARNMLDTEVIHTTELINEYTTNIADLNHKIYQAETLGDNPNDWLDQRDMFVEKLSALINITIDTSDPNEYLVHTNGKVLVQGNLSRNLFIDNSADEVGTHIVRWEDTGEELDYTGGKISALVDLRNKDLRGEIQQLNKFAILLTDGTNNLHRQGYTLSGQAGEDFFVETPAVINAQGNLDLDQDGIFDESRIFRLTGTHKMTLNSNIGISGEMTFQGGQGEETVTVSYNPNDTVKDVIDRINYSGAEVTVGIDANDKLTIRANTSQDLNNPDFVIRTLQDTGEFLAGYTGILTAPGAEGAFNWRQGDAVNALTADASYGVSPFLAPAGSISINPNIRLQPQNIAASRLGQDGVVDMGDGGIALQIAQIRTGDVGFGNNKSFDDFLSETVASIATRGQEAEINVKTQTVIMDQLRAKRSEVSGVNLDEELQDMIKFQTAYGAAAKFLSNLNENFDALLNMV